MLNWCHPTAGGLQEWKISFLFKNKRDKLYFVMWNLKESSKKFGDLFYKLKINCWVWKKKIIEEIYVYLLAVAIAVS